MHYYLVICLLSSTDQIYHQGWGNRNRVIVIVCNRLHVLFSITSNRNLIDYSAKKCCYHDYFFNYFSITFQQLLLITLENCKTHCRVITSTVFHIPELHVYFLQCYTLKCLHETIFIQLLNKKTNPICSRK